MQEKNKKNTEISARILQIIENQEVTPNLFAKKLGYDRSQTVYDIINSKSAPSYDFFKRFEISEYSEIINISWLLTGQGEMLKTKSTKINTTSSKRFSQIVDSKDKGSNNSETNNGIAEKNFSIPLYDVSTSAGYGSFDEMIDSEKLVGNFAIPGFTNIDWMIYVSGSSMYPKYSSGDIIACRVLRESQFIQWGKVYVLATREQGILVKRLKKCESENYLTAVCDNPAYDAFDVPKDEILGIALVVGVIRLE
jgi:phage repressor protein C with HTH and peptisase S24 domain